MDKNKQKAAGKGVAPKDGQKDTTEQPKAKQIEVNLNVIVPWVKVAKPKADEPARLTGRIVVLEPKRNELAKLFYSPGRIEKALLVTQNATGKIQLTCDDAERLLTFKHKTPGKKFQAESITLTDLVYEVSIDDEGEEIVKAAISFEQPGLAASLEGYYQHLGYDVFLRIEKMQGELFNDEPPDGKTMDE